MSTAVTQETPRIWVGCLACYNAGRLVGEWFDCTDPDEVSAIDLAAVHAGAGGSLAGCEELWCLDTDMIPVDHEMGLHEAAQWAECVQEAGLEQWPAVCAWVRSGAYVAKGTGEVPVISDFEERYCGHWDSFVEYSDQLAEDTGLMKGWPEEAVRYFDWTTWKNDLSYEYTVMDAPADQGYGVYIFQNL